MTTKFDAGKFFRRVFWVVVAAGVGIGSQADTMNWEQFDFSSAAIAAFVWGVIRAGWGWYVTSARAGMILLLALPPLLLTGCISVPWTANPLKSQGVVKLEETQGDYSLDLLIKDNGDGTFARNFRYRGEGEKPWEMSLNANTEITSPALTASIEAIRPALESLPGVIETFGDMPDSPGARSTWLGLVFDFLGQNPNLISQLMGRLAGGL